MRKISIILLVLCFSFGLGMFLLDYKTKTDTLNATAIELQLSQEESAAIRAQAAIDAAEAQASLNAMIAQNAQDIEEIQSLLTISRASEAALQNLVAEKNAEIAIKGGQIANLQLSLEVSELRVSEIELQMQTTEQNINLIIDEVVLQNPQIVVEGTAIETKVESTTAQLQEKIVELDALITTQNQTISALQLANTNLQTELDNAQTLLAEITASSGASEEVLATLIARVLAIYPEAVVVSIPEDVPSSAEVANMLSLFLEDKIETLQTQLSSSAAQVVELQSEVADKQTTIEHYLETISELAIKLSNIETVIVAEFFNNDIEQLQNFQNADENPANWLSLAQVLQIKVDELQASISSLNLDISNLNAEKLVLQAEVEQLTTDLATAQAEVATLKTTLMQYVEYKYENLQFNYTFETPFTSQYISSVSTAVKDIFDGKMKLSFYMKDTSLVASTLYDVFNFDLTYSENSEFGTYKFIPNFQSGTFWFISITLPQTFSFTFSIPDSNYACYYISTCRVYAREESAFTSSPWINIGTTGNNPFSDLRFNGVVANKLADDLTSSQAANLNLQNSVNLYMLNDSLRLEFMEAVAFRINTYGGTEIEQIYPISQQKIYELILSYDNDYCFYSTIFAQGFFDATTYELLVDYAIVEQYITDYCTNYNLYSS